MRPADPNDLAEARAEERSRIKAIIASPEAKGREQVALNLALGSDMSVEDLRATLTTLPTQTASPPGNLHMSAPAAASLATASASESVANSWKAAFERIADR